MNIRTWFLCELFVRNFIFRWVRTKFFAQLNDQTVLYLTIQFSISHLFAHSLNVKHFDPYVWPIYRTLSSATIPVQSGPWSNGNERSTSHSPNLQDWSLTIRLFCVISRTLEVEVLLLCRDTVGVFYSPSRLGLKAIRINWFSQKRNSFN